MKLARCRTRFLRWTSPSQDPTRRLSRLSINLPPMKCFCSFSPWAWVPGLDGANTWCLVFLLEGTGLADVLSPGMRGNQKVPESPFGDTHIVLEGVGQSFLLGFFLILLYSELVVWFDGLDVTLPIWVAQGGVQIPLKPPRRKLTDLSRRWPHCPSRNVAHSVLFDGVCKELPDGCRATFVVCALAADEPMSLWFFSATGPQMW